MAETALKMAVDLDQLPLVVDLDGTLIRSDLLVESAFSSIGRHPLSAIGLLRALGNGKAALKAHIAASTDVDVTVLPYDPSVIDLIEKARAAGRKCYLASASHERYVRAVSEHLGLFDGCFGSSREDNLASASKARLLVATFGRGGFDYIGDSRADLEVWAVSATRIAVDPSPHTLRALLKIDPDAVVVRSRVGGPLPWIRLLRVHQWAKNGLVLLPLLLAHRFDPASLGLALAAFVAFSLAASGIYLVNDLVDIEADRKHRTKKNRPLAAGTVPLTRAVAVAPCLLAAAMLGASLISWRFTGVLFGYLLLTTAYTFVLKRKMMVDVITLGLLYTLRVFGGAAAVGVPLSEWLLAFSMFIFASLALIKRYVELAARLDADLPDPTNRNYRKGDLPIVASLAGASGFNAVTVFALYVSSDQVRQLYHHPTTLWLVCPILMYWLGRALMMAHRRLMHDDPIVFALKDWNSLVALALIGAVVIGAL